METGFGRRGLVLFASPQKQRLAPRHAAAIFLSRSIVVADSLVPWASVHENPSSPKETHKKRIEAADLNVLLSTQHFFLARHAPHRRLLYRRTTRDLAASCQLTAGWTDWTVHDSKPAILSRQGAH